MTVHQATAEVFLTAFKALPRRGQEDILGRIARDRRLRRVLEDISDRLAMREERGKPSWPLRDYIAERGRNWISLLFTLTIMGLPWLYLQLS